MNLNVSLDQAGQNICSMCSLSTCVFLVCSVNDAHVWCVVVFCSHGGTFGKYSNPCRTVRRRPTTRRRVSQLCIWLWLSKPMVPFWDRCTTHFILFQWGLGCSLGVRDFDPWPYVSLRNRQELKRRRRDEPGRLCGSQACI